MTVTDFELQGNNIWLFCVKMLRVQCMQSMDCLSLLQKNQKHFLYCIFRNVRHVSTAIGCDINSTKKFNKGSVLI